jgi:hypothetical protein
LVKINSSNSITIHDEKSVLIIKSNSCGKNKSRRSRNTSIAGTRAGCRDKDFLLTIGTIDSDNTSFLIGKIEITVICYNYGLSINLPGGGMG